MYYFVKRLITTAMDRSNREREMASHVLSSLYADVSVISYIILTCVFYSVCEREMASHVLSSLYADVSGIDFSLC